MTTCDRCGERLPDNDYPHTCTPPDVEAALMWIRMHLSPSDLYYFHTVNDALRAIQNENGRLRSTLEQITANLEVLVRTNRVVGNPKNVCTVAVAFGRETLAAPPPAGGREEETGQ